MTLQVSPAAADEQPILANLIQLYAHDFSEFHDIDPGPDGRFVYEPLPLYWLEPGRHPFLLRMDSQLAGFALVKNGSPVSGGAAIWDMAEFFILRRFRKRGIGTDAAHNLWRRFPGGWEIRLMESNRPACQFWERSIAAFAGKAIPYVRLEKSGQLWRLFSFESARV